MNEHPFYQCLEQLVETPAGQYFLDSEVKAIDLGLDFDHPDYAKSYSTLQQPYQPLHRLSIIPVTSGDQCELSWFLAECLTNKQQQLYRHYEDTFGYPQEQLYAIIQRKNYQRADETNELLALFDTYESAQAYAQPFAFREGVTIQQQIDTFYETCEQRCHQHGLSLFDYEPFVTVKHRNKHQHDYWFELTMRADPTQGALITAHEYGNTFLDGNKFADDLAAFVKLNEYIQQYQHVKTTIQFIESEQWEIAVSIPLTAQQQCEIRYLIPNTSEALGEKVEQIIQEIDLCHFCGVKRDQTTQVKKYKYER